jgi:isocitrate/isopropylmalate dehydrogenase
MRQHTSACVSIRQHTSAYVSIRQHQHALAYVSTHHTSVQAPARPVQRALQQVKASEEEVFTTHQLVKRGRVRKERCACGARKHASAYTSIRQHTSAYVSNFRTHQLVKSSRVRKERRACGARKHTSTYVSIRQHTSAYVSIRQHMSAYVSIRQTRMRSAQHTSDANGERAAEFGVFRSEYIYIYTCI